MTSSATRAPAAEYVLSDDLAKLCLPREYKDSNRRLAWVNSIVCLFVAVGFVGLMPPKVVVKPLSEQVEIVPVVFTPPEEPPPTQPQSETHESTPPSDATVDTPVVATVVAADASSVAFAVPVQGPVILAPNARFAAPPPLVTQSAPKPVAFNVDTAVGGSYPNPTYPREELAARHEGKVMIYAVVDTNGALTSVTVKDSSGYPGLDRHALQQIKSRWRFPPGKVRYYYVPIVFQILP